MEKERRVKVLSVIALIVAVLGLTIAFAAMSTTLKINGTAEMNPAEWKIYFNDLKDAEIIGGASEVNAPNIGTDLVSIENINVKLTKPGDTITYKVDLVNDGDIDAKISNIETPTLSEEAQKIIEFKVKYTSDNKEITIHDILRKHTTENVTITIKFKTDVTEKDLPSGGLDVDLSYKIVYAQSDGKGNDHNGEASVPKIDVDSLKPGDEVTLGEEEFYIISTTSDTITMLAKYNLLVGNIVNVDISGLNMSSPDLNDIKVLSTTPISKDTSNYGLQSPSAKAAVLDTTWIGVTAFANKDESRRILNCNDEYGCHYGYWANTSGNLLDKYGKSYPVNVYDSNSIIYSHVKNYEKYLKTKYPSASARLITYNELVNLGCSLGANFTLGSCEKAPSWVYSTSYWTASALNAYDVLDIYSIGITAPDLFYTDHALGIRPVITISKSEF